MIEKKEIMMAIGKEERKEERDNDGWGKRIGKKKRQSWL